MNKLNFYKPKAKRLKSGTIYIVIITFLSFLTLEKIRKEEYFDVFMFSILIGISLIKLISIIFNRPTVIVNVQGIKNNTNWMGLIKWTEIDKLEMLSLNNHQLLIFRLSNQEEFLKNKNPISRWLLKSNIKKLGSPVAISKNEFNMSLEQVIFEIQTFKANLFDN